MNVHRPTGPPRSTSTIMATSSACTTALRATNPRIAKNPPCRPNSEVDRRRVEARADRRQGQRVHEQRERSLVPEGERAQPFEDDDRHAGHRDHRRTGHGDDAPRERGADARHRVRARRSGGEERVEQPTPARGHRLGALGRAVPGAPRCLPVVPALVPALVLVRHRVGSSSSSSQGSRMGTPSSSSPPSALPASSGNAGPMREASARPSSSDQREQRDRHDGHGPEHRDEGQRGRRGLADQGAASGSCSNATNPFCAPPLTAMRRSPATAMARIGDPSATPRQTSSPVATSIAASSPSIVGTIRCSPTSTGTVRSTIEFCAKSQRCSPESASRARDWPSRIGHEDRPSRDHGRGRHVERGNRDVATRSAPGAGGERDHRGLR